MGGFSNSFLPGESLGMPDDEQNPLWRLLNSLPGRDEYGNQIPNLGGIRAPVRTPPFNPSAPAPVSGTPKQPGSSKLEKLMMFLAPAASGFITSLTGRRRDRKRNFLLGALGGGGNVLQGEVARRERKRLELKEAAEKAVTEKRAAEAHTADIGYKTAQTEKLRTPTAEKPQYELKERKLSDGSTVMERVNVDTGEAIPVTTEETASPAPPLVGVGPGTPVTRRVPFGSAAPAKPEIESRPVRDKDELTGKMIFVEGNPKHSNFGKKITEVQTTAPRPEKPTAGEERKQREALVRRAVDNAVAAAKQEVSNFDTLEPEDQINAIQDIARDAVQDDPERLRPIMKETLDEINAIVRRRRAPQKSGQARLLDKAAKQAGVQR